jgi:hypothetical protein
MPQVGFEPTIPVFEREKTVHASSRAATLLGNELYCSIKGEELNDRLIDY